MLKGQLVFNRVSICEGLPGKGHCMAEEQQTVEYGGAYGGGGGGSKYIESVRSNEDKSPSSDQLSSKEGSRGFSSKEESPRNPRLSSKEESPQDPQDAQQNEAASPTPSKALITLVKDAEGENETSPHSVASMGRGSLNRDLVLAKLNQERTLSLIKAWEENMIAKSHNRYQKKVAKISAWEKAKRAKAEADLKTFEEKLEKKKAEYVEKMSNKIAAVHMRAEEERALADAHHGEEVLKAEELAAKYRASGRIPKRYPFCCTF